MTSSKGLRTTIKTFAVLMALALPVSIAVSSMADARGGRGGSFGSRGSRTYAPPPATNTAPGAATPMNRTMSQPASPGMSNAAGAATAAKGGMFSRPGLMGGLAAGFLGAGLLGMMFGGGLFGGLGGIASFLGLLLQVGLIALIAMFALRWWRSRNAPSYANGPANFDAGQNAGPSPQPQAPQGGQFGGGMGQGGMGQGGMGQAGGFGFGSGMGAAAVATKPLEITPDDYESFEKLLTDVQAAWSNEDRSALSRVTTPEMESYFADDLADNAAKGVVNKVSDVKLLQGDLSEAWREGSDDYATVAMRFGLVDKTFDKASGKLVDGSDQPVEATEIWTFVRPKNQGWVLSAIQQIA